MSGMYSFLSVENAVLPRFYRHEHLYGSIEHNLIRSDEFPKDIRLAERLLLGARVMLCTLSMLSNTALAPFIRLVPIETVIVDEASQIEVGDYLPLLATSRTLKKIVFIGDDKQRESKSPY